MEISEEAYLAHYGILRRSGRYPWGSSGNVDVYDEDFLGAINKLKAEGMSESVIAKGFGISTTTLRAQKSIAKNQIKAADTAMAQRLRAKGLSHAAIGERMGGKNESSVRALLAASEKEKEDILKSTTDMLRGQVKEKTLIDIGSGVETQLCISKEKLNTAVSVLKEEGYVVHRPQVPQLGTGLDTRNKILAPPGTTYSDIQNNLDKIHLIHEYSEDGGRSYTGPMPPLAINPNRVGIKYGKDGGSEADGVIYVRPGVKDVDLGGNMYAQVRVAVGDEHYLKGMAVYKDDLPSGVDLVFNTSKSDTGNKLDAMKPINDDPDNPFSASIRRQIKEQLPDGTYRVTSSMNLVNEEGNWATWTKNLASQMLSKQSPKLAKTQLDMTYEDKATRFSELSSLTNPTLRKHLLIEFGDSVDSAAVQLAAYRMPGQAWHTILPINSLKETEVYAPNYKDGTRVAVIRYPHSGPFEIPELTVNNKNREGKQTIGDTRGAIGINHSVAVKLSGADFDGDPVLVIPNDHNRIKAAPSLDGLRDFDPRIAYPKYDGMRRMSKKQTGPEMGKIANLITDMTIRNASSNEIAAAVRHSMVVIDAEKHYLNYKQSALDNNIKSLKAHYQRGGASTLISRAKSPEYVPHRKPRTVALGGPIDKVTGERMYEPSGMGRKTSKVTKMSLISDAHTLVSESPGTPIERLYADHANRLKALANKARLKAINTPPATYSKSARRTYASEVTSLNHKLALAVQNRPLERQAQRIGNAIVKMKQDADPTMEYSTLKTIKNNELEKARIRTGAKKAQIHITDDEWNAIQAGAISDTKLQDILNNADNKRVMELATPKRVLLMTNAKTARAESMLASGYTRAEVAQHLGVSLTTLDTTMKGE